MPIEIGMEAWQRNGFCIQSKRSFQQAPPDQAACSRSPPQDVHFWSCPWLLSAGSEPVPVWFVEAVLHNLSLKLRAQWSCISFLTYLFWKVYNPQLQCSSPVTLSTVFLWQQLSHNFLIVSQFPVPPACDPCSLVIRHFIWDGNLFIVWEESFLIPLGWSTSISLLFPKMLLVSGSSQTSTLFLLI